MARATEQPLSFHSSLEILSRLTAGVEQEDWTVLCHLPLSCTARGAAQKQSKLWRDVRRKGFWSSRDICCGKAGPGHPDRKNKGAEPAVTSPSALRTVGSVAGGQGHGDGSAKDQSTAYLANAWVENGN